MKGEVVDPLGHVGLYVLLKLKKNVGKIDINWCECFVKLVDKGYLGKYWFMLIVNCPYTLTQIILLIMMMIKIGLFNFSVPS